MPSNIQYQSSRCGTNKLEIIGKHIFVNGKLTDGVPPSNYYKVSQVNDRLFVNGYEYIDGYWKRTLKAIWHKLF